MDMKVYVEGKSKTELLRELGGSEPGSTVFELQKAGITVRCTEDLEARMNKLGETVSDVGATLSEAVAALTNEIKGATLLVRGQIHELDATIQDANAQNEALQKKLLFLNVILTIATVVAALATATEAWKAFHVP